jgi:hypothetical protein
MGSKPPPGSKVIIQCREVDRKMFYVSEKNKFLKIFLIGCEATFLFSENILRGVTEPVSGNLT